MKISLEVNTELDIAQRYAIAAQVDSPSQWVRIHEYFERHKWEDKQLERLIIELRKSYWHNGTNKDIENFNTKLLALTKYIKKNH